MTTLSLPVSLGEAYDKLSILDIKRTRIQDPSKVEHCQREYDAIQSLLPTGFEYEYRLLRWINESIWTLQDHVRSVGPTRELLTQILDENDVRFRIKDRINRLSASLLREQKGYSPRRVFFLGHLGLGDLINYVGAIRYYALLYDEVVVVCKKHNIDNAQDFFADEPSVKFYPVESDHEISPPYGASKQTFHDVVSKFDKVVLCGFHKNPSTFQWDGISDCFYHDMGIPLEIRKVFFKIPESLSQLKYDGTFRFVHQTSSTRTLPLVTWDINDVFTIDPNTNLYAPDHPWYALAQSYIGHRLSSYAWLIEHAEEVHVVNSSFACLAAYLPLQGRVARSYDRDTGLYLPGFTFNHR